MQFFYKLNQIKLNKLSLILQGIIAISFISFFTTLFLPHIGEEGVYTISSLEMLFNKNYLVPTLFGQPYPRPPLYNWLILAVAKLLGTTNMLTAARLVTVFATMVMAWLLINFVKRIFHNNQFALFCTCIFLSSDLLMRRGWLAYSDPVFAAFIFAAMLGIWYFLEYKKTRWLLFSCFNLCLGYLTKVYTIYIFYTLTILVLLWQHSNRKYLFKLQSLLLHGIAFMFPWYWANYITSGHNDMLTNIAQTQSAVQSTNVLQYILKFLTYPINIIILFMPISIISCFVLIKYKNKFSNFPEIIKIICWIILLNLLPYWLSSVNLPRYIMPLYPFIALLLAYLIWQQDAKYIKIAIYSLIIILFLKFLVAIYWFPYEQTIKKGNAAVISQQILHHTKGHDLYTNDSSSAGLRVAFEINRLRYPAEPLINKPNWCGYMLSNSATNFDPNVNLVYIYPIGSDKIYLYYKDTAICQN